MASYLSMRAKGGEWLVRMEDLDTPRVVPGAADGILRTLEAFGFEWDGSVVFQSERQELYRTKLELMQKAGVIYPCTCTRREIADSALRRAAGERRYPGTCRMREYSKGLHALRVRVDDEPVSFDDRILGPQSQRVESEVGDFILRRADGVYAYQFAVVIDDEDQAITEVLRGADLLSSTGRQIYLHRLLGFRSPEYAHVPVVLNSAGEKLSKQTGASALDERRPLHDLHRAFEFLNQKSVAATNVAEFWRLAIAEWDESRVPKKPTS